MKITTNNTISSVTWNDYDNLYGTKSTATELEKEEQWERFEGQIVTWLGTVLKVNGIETVPAVNGIETVNDSVTESLKANGTERLDDCSLEIKMNADSLTSDIILKLKENQNLSAILLASQLEDKPQNVSFTGKIERANGAFFPLLMDEGEFMDEGEIK